MTRIIRWSIFFFSLLIITNDVFCPALADDEHNEKSWYRKHFDRDDDHDRGKKKRRYQKRSQKNDEHQEKTVFLPLNPTFKEHCGACRDIG